MTDLKSIHDVEVQNRTRMMFYRMGEQWRAYNRSAWFVAEGMKPSTNPEGGLVEGFQLVWLSFTEEELNTLLSPFKFIVRKDDVMICESPIPFNINAYYRWKGDVLTSLRKPRPEVLEVPTEDKFLLLKTKIRSFDLDRSTPRTCLSFIKELQNLMSDE